MNQHRRINKGNRRPGIFAINRQGLFERAGGGGDRRREFARRSHWKKCG